MKYTKQSIEISDQIDKLKNRGLIITDEEKAAHYLSNISYYRLRAYTYPFQNNESEDHVFVKKVTFEEIINLYVFDRQLRLLLFNAIEKIEVSFRTKVIYHYALEHGSHWYLNSDLYKNSAFFVDHMASLNKEINRSAETFIKHYKKKYSDPKEPPSWMSLEVSSLGLLSKIFKNLKEDGIKKSLAYSYGLKDVGALENWFFCLSIIRNIVAHHGRIWNRRIPPFSIPKKTHFPFLENKKIYPNKIYIAISTMVYFLEIISPNNKFKQNFIELMDKCPLLQEKEMGFPDNWRDEHLWSSFNN
jgi:abortive infection bacteriophage resistance protein